MTGGRADAQFCAATRRRRRRRTRARAGVAAGALVLLGAMAPVAQAKGHSYAEFTCKAIVLHYTGFPSAAGNTVRENVRIDRVVGAVEKVFVFDGTEGTDTIPLNLSPGHHGLDVFSHWRTNGIRGGRDQGLPKGIKCEPEPELAIEKRQKLESQAGYTTVVLTPGHVGETVDYEIVVRNLGNVPLVLKGFSDPRCDTGTITGGPGEAPLAPAGLSSPPGETTYRCTHTLTLSDREAGSYSNTAAATALPQGCPVRSPCGALTRESNTVVVLVPTPPVALFTIEKLQATTGSFTSAPLVGEVGQTVSYEIIVKNTGSAPLQLTNFSDEKCDPGTIAGGPGAAALEPGESTTYTCSHVLTAADASAGRYENVARDTGATPDGLPATQISNVVLVTVTGPPPSPGPSPAGGTLSTTGASALAGRGEVLAFGSARASSAHACLAHAGYLASVTGTGIASVTFSLDGRRLAKVSRANSQGAFTARVYVRSRGRHHLIMRVTFTAASNTAAMTLRRTLARCSTRATATPRFVG